MDWHTRGKEAESYRFYQIAQRIAIPGSLRALRDITQHCREEDAEGDPKIFGQAP